jgi:hypothetical protein
MIDPATSVLKTLDVFQSCALASLDSPFAENFQNVLYYGFSDLRPQGKIAGKKA